MPSKTKQPTIAITGAGGFLGSTLVEHFSALGWNVIGLVRKPADYTHTHATFRKYDLTGKLDPRVLDGVDYLVHAAYIKYDREHPDAMDLNFAGAKRLLELSRKKNLQKNIFISSMSSHEAALSVYGKQKLAIEQLFSESTDVVLRCGLIIGKGGIVKQMADFMRTKHAVPLIGGGKQPLQIVAVTDLAAVIEKTATSKLHGTFTIATPQVYSYKEFYEALARAIRTKVIFVPLPFNLLLAAFKTAAALRLPLGVGEDNLLGLKALRSAETAADLKKIGVRLSSLEEALARTKP